MMEEPHRDSGASTPGANELQPRRILFLDAYDSFTNNIISLLKDALGHDVHIHVLHMDLKTLATDSTPDWTPEQFLERINSFDAVVCGPGPGSPLCEEDVGVFRLLWDLPRHKAVPVMGICLGFQSLVEHFGGRIRKLRRGLHGMVRSIDHKGLRYTGRDDIFEGVVPFKATLYHSLCADIGQDDVADSAWTDERWKSPECAPDLIPLAWITEPEQDNERVFMAARHASMPFWGVQYHPESVCTEAGAMQVLRNWFAQATNWNDKMARRIQPWVLPSVHSDSLDSPSRGNTPKETEISNAWLQQLDSGLAAANTSPTYVCRQIHLPNGVDGASVADILCKNDKEAVLLDSSSTANGDPLARNTIIALEADKALRLTYHCGDTFVQLRQHATAGQNEIAQRIDLPRDIQHSTAAWQVISEYWRRRRAHDDVDEPAFKGGFMGFVSYEMGLSKVSPASVSTERSHSRPDLCMAWISKSVVLDHKAGLVYVQGLVDRQADTTWLDATVAELQSSSEWLDPGSGRMTENTKAQLSPEELLRDVANRNGPVQMKVPDVNAYEEDVRRCQYAIKEGHSYELCLTAQTVMSRPASTSAGQDAFRCSENGVTSCWDIYRTLRARQPAPFGSFIRLGGATILSSSPERFLMNDSQGLCSMRPMKGTVRKSDAVSTLKEAEKILHVPKEEAENLMIVDLVRHDLHGVCGPGQVTVPDLLRVEEYATVFQMITVVNGQLPRGDSMESQTKLNGLDVLAASLPPGSMTGAPKKRSCELLKVIEPCERSVYSGVIGYFDVKGRGDWSVTIRTMFHWDDEVDESSGEPREIWRIGAGGAVTTLSTPVGEREEMFTKLCGPLGTFRDVA